MYLVLALCLNTWYNDVESMNTIERGSIIGLAFVFSDGFIGIGLYLDHVVTLIESHGIW